MNKYRIGCQFIARHHAHTFTPPATFALTVHLPCFSMTEETQKPRGNLYRQRAKLHTEPTTLELSGYLYITRTYGKEDEA